MNKYEIFTAVIRMASLATVQRVHYMSLSLGLYRTECWMPLFNTARLMKYRLSASNVFFEPLSSIFLIDVLTRFTGHYCSKTSGNFSLRIRLPFERDTVYRNSQTFHETTKKLSYTESG